MDNQEKIQQLEASIAQLVALQSNLLGKVNDTMLMVVLLNKRMDQIHDAHLTQLRAMASSPQLDPELRQGALDRITDAERIHDQAEAATDALLKKLDGGTVTPPPA